MPNHDKLAGYHDSNQRDSKNNIINLGDGGGVLGLGAHHFRSGEGDKAGGNYFSDDRHQVENMNY